MINLKKKIIATIAMSSLVFITACQEGNNVNSEDANQNNNEVEEGTNGKDEVIKFWTSSNSFEERAEQYGIENDLNIEITFIPNADIQNKLKQSIGSTATSPDVFIVGRDFVNEWHDMPGSVVNLSEAYPDDISYYEENTYETFIEVGSSEGNVYGLTDQFPVGMMYYNREIAQELFGTDDYLEVANQLNSFEKIIELNDQLDDSYKMFGTFQNLTMALFTSRTEPWIEENQFVIDSFVDDYMELSKTVYENDMILTETEDDSYFSGFQTGSFFIDYIPTWGYRSKVKPQVENDTTTATWGVTNPTVPYIRGGSYYFIPESANNKDGAWEIIKGLALDEKNLYDYYTGIYDLSALESVNQELYSSGISEDALGGQEIFKVYGEQAEIVQEKFGDSAPVTSYDYSVNEFLRVAAVSYATDKLTKEEALADFESQLTGAYPEITVVYE